MFNRKSFIAVSVLAFTSILACKHAEIAKGPDSQEGWASRMQQLSQSLSTLIPLSMDPVEFNKPANQPLIEQNVLRIAEFAHDLGQMNKKPSQDPTLPYISEELKGNMLEAKRQLDNNNLMAAREIIQNTTHYCISCHTQTNNGPQFLSTNTSDYFTKLRPLAKAQYFMAVRNFDSALQEFDRAMNSPDAAIEPYQNVENAALKALAVAVRVKRDPKLAEEMVSRIIDAPWAPIYLKVNARQWKSAILEWQKQKPKPTTVANAKLLMAQGWNKSMETPMGRGGLIYFLRASSMLSDYLASEKDGPTYAEAVYNAGLVAETLRELHIMTLDEAYYESCIRRWPSSDIARKCYIRLESRILTRNGVFDGGRIPRSVEERLSHLRTLATPNSQDW